MNAKVDQVGPDAFVDGLDAALTIRAIIDDRFVGRAPPGRPRIYGGHLMAQALLAANATVVGQRCHSFHALFVRPGESALPVTYAVDRLKDGASFTLRRVIAMQEGREIFALTASFQANETGLSHQSAGLPVGPGPSDGWTERPCMTGDADAVRRTQAMTPTGFEARWAYRADPGVANPAVAKVWVRAARRIGNEPVLHQAALAYTSDFAMLEPVILPHGLTWTDARLRLVSLDQGMWFHRSVDFHSWTLLTAESPVTGDGRGFARGTMHDESGALIASVVQEGAFRVDSMPNRRKSRRHSEYAAAYRQP